MSALVPILSHDRAALLQGDAALIGAHVGENFVDAIVTDPPAGISFMGREWDGDKGGRAQWIAWLRDLLASSFRALKPGGHAFVWALPRTSHWTATAVEDVGFEIRDVHHHLFGTGFPKSLTAASAEIPNGSGTALKPAVEHWILARKPLDGTLEQNYAKWGTGLLAIDACRIEGAPDAPGTTPLTANADRQTHSAMIRQPYVVPDGRWPSHLSLDEYSAGVLNDQAGVRRSGALAAGTPRGVNAVFGKAPGSPAASTDIASSRGGASRFFYVAKATRAERDAGLDHLAAFTGGQATGRVDGSAGTKNARAGAGRNGGARNTHPTVKSLALMRWLVRLITPPGGIVLDPFAGSGSTGVAALQEGARFIGVELGGDNDAHIPILVGRIRHALETTKDKDSTP